MTVEDTGLLEFSLRIKNMSADVTRLTAEVTKVMSQ